MAAAVWEDILKENAFFQTLTPSRKTTVTKVICELSKQSLQAVSMLTKLPYNNSCLVFFSV